MIVLGIDPGVHGALAWLDTDTRRIVRVIDMPTVKATRGKSAMDVDGRLFGGWVDAYHPHRAVVEQVSSRPRQAGQFAFGTNYGRILGVLECLSIPIQHASPQKWKQEMGLRGQDKSMSVRLAVELFPTCARLFHGERGAGLDGRAEAALLAYYGGK
jgi:crossover junction endodeoxyribonuclease RuvC